MRRIAAFVDLVLLLVCALPALAGEDWYPILHNDHDVLAVGEIVAIESGEIVVSVMKTIVNADAPEETVSRQQAPLSVRITAPATYHLFAVGDEIAIGGIPAVGDSVVASLEQDGEGYRVKWGLFKADRSDYKTLSVQCATYGGESVAAILSLFVNSDGTVHEVEQAGDALYITIGGEQVKLSDVVRPTPGERSPASEPSVGNPDTFVPIALPGSTPLPEPPQGIAREAMLAAAWVLAVLFVMCVVLYVVYHMRRRITKK